jgi:hypothetical protein
MSRIERNQRTARLYWRKVAKYSFGYKQHVMTFRYHQ